MKLATVFVFVLAAVGAHASPAGKWLICSEAAWFGVLQVFPPDLQPGTDFTVHVDFECAVEHFGIISRYTDFWIEVPSSNNGHEPAILLARRDFTVPAPPLSPALTFTAQLPHYPVYFEGASYVIALNTIYPINGTDGNEVLVQGGVHAGINVTSS